MTTILVYLIPAILIVFILLYRMRTNVRSVYTKRSKRKKAETDNESLLSVSQGPAFFDDSSSSPLESLGSKIGRASKKVSKFITNLDSGQKSVSDINFLTPQELADEKRRKWAPTGLVKAPQYRYSYQNGTAVNVFGPYDPNAKMQMVYDTDSLDSSYIDDAPLVVAPPRRPPPPIPKQLDGVGSINKLHNSASRKQLLSDIRKIGNLTKPSVILKKLNRNHQ